MERILLANGFGKTRRVVEGGRSYLVAPITSITADGVLPGSKGPLYYPSSETKKRVKHWDGTPIVVYHPTRNGQNVSAHDTPEGHIGQLRNSAWRGKLVHEGWFDEELTRAADPRVHKALVDNRPMEISTGLFTQNEDRAGVSPRGRPYEGIARDHRPDHMAILPDQVGACSVNDGCGLMVNERGELVDNPAVSEAQRRYLNATKGHDWVKEHEFDNKGSLPERVENDEECEEDDMETKRVRNSFMGWLGGVLGLTDNMWSDAAREAAADARKAGGKGSEPQHTPGNFHSTSQLVDVGHHSGQEMMGSKDVQGHLASAGVKSKTPWLSGSHANVSDAKGAIDKLKSAGYSHLGYHSDPDTGERHEMLRGNGHDVTVSHNFSGSGKVSVSKQGTPNPSVSSRMARNSEQPRHPREGTYQGKTEVAARQGRQHTGGSQQASETDPDDDDDYHPEIGMGDRPAQGLDASKIGKKTDDSPNTDPRARGNAGVRQVANADPAMMADPRKASAQANKLTMKVKGPDADHDDHEAACDAHGQAAMAHMQAGNHAAAMGHLQQAQAHQQFAGTGGVVNLRTDFWDVNDLLLINESGSGGFDSDAQRRAFFGHLAGGEASSPKGKTNFAGEKRGGAQEAGGSKAQGAGGSKHQGGEPTHGTHAGGASHEAAAKSHEAHAKSASANKGSRASGHNKAAELHKEAAKLHFTASKQSTGEMKAGHAKAAAEHNAIAKRHLEKAQTATRNTAEENPMRMQMIPQAVINACTCQATKAALLAHNAKAEGSNADVTGSGGTTVQAGDEEDSDLEEYKSKKGQGLEDGVKVGQAKISAGEYNVNRLCQQLFGADHATVREAIQFTTNQRKQERLQLIHQLTANILNDQQRQHVARIYAGLPLEQLHSLAAAQPQMVGNEGGGGGYDLDLNQFGGRRLANFTGAAGGPDFGGGYGGEPVDNEDQPIPPTINYKELAEENRRLSGSRQ